MGRRFIVPIVSLMRRVECTFLTFILVYKSQTQDILMQKFQEDYDALYNEYINITEDYDDLKNDYWEYDVTE